MTKTDKLQQMLGKLQQNMLQNMLQDLNNPDKRGPQLYNAIIKELQRNGIDCLPKAGDQDSNALQKLLDASRAQLQDYYTIAPHAEA